MSLVSCTNVSGQAVISAGLSPIRDHPGAGQKGPTAPQTEYLARHRFGPTGLARLAAHMGKRAVKQAFDGRNRMQGSQLTGQGAQEWRNHWTLPVAAMLGYSTSSLHTYGIGSFIEPLQTAFHWTRAETTFGLTIAGLLGMIMAIPIGTLVDRIGPRIIGLFGVAAMTGAFALLGTANGSLANWIMLWVILAIANLGLQGTVWTKAVGSRFEHSRGLAFATTLSGAPVTAAVLPPIATWLIAKYDWQTAFAGVGLIWFVAATAVMFPFFRGAQEAPASDQIDSSDAAEMTGLTFADAARDAGFYKLMLACGLFAFTVLGLIVHFVPILTGQGAEKMAAAGIASLVGIFSIVGRFCTGFLLDRMPSHLVGAAVFLFPVVSCSLLLLDGSTPTSQMIAAVLFGLTVGAEIDVIAYLASRRFGLQNYGSIFGAMMAALSVGVATGPLVAAKFFDHFGGYSQFLVLTMVAMVISALALLSINRGDPVQTIPTRKRQSPGQ
jgi:MFS family permease